MNFTFKTKLSYEAACRTGGIDHYDIVRIVRTMTNGDEWDIPTHSEEEFNELMDKYRNNPNVMEITHYPDVSYYDLEEYS